MSEVSHLKGTQKQSYMEKCEVLSDAVLRTLQLIQDGKEHVTRAREGNKDITLQKCSSNAKQMCDPGFGWCLLMLVSSISASISAFGSM